MQQDDSKPPSLKREEDPPSGNRKVKGYDSIDPNSLRAKDGLLKRSLFWGAWVFVGFAVIVRYFGQDKLVGLSAHPLGKALAAVSALSQEGLKELFEFLSTHLVSAMVPAFFLAAAISTFFSKNTIIRAMGRNANPFFSYPLAAMAGAVLTVCSCGVLPIFMSILQSGAGIGPAITFLYCSPAINLISIIYTWKILPISMLWARIAGVVLSGILIGMIMSRLFDEPSEKRDEPAVAAGVRSPYQEGFFFLLLLLVMLTSTDVFSFITSRIIPSSVFSSMYSTSEAASAFAALIGKLSCIAVEIILVVVILRAWFTSDETRKWLKRTYRQAKQIIPMVFLGIFFSGMLGGSSGLIDYLDLVKTNRLGANIISSFIGAMLYFGSIVGVNVVDLFIRWGMNAGPALALLLSGPSISLPSVLALLPIINRNKTFVFLLLVIIFSAICGYTYGQFTGS